MEVIAVDCLTVPERKLLQVDTHYPQRMLSDMAADIKRRCIISATLTESQNTNVITELRAKPKVFKSSMGQWMDQL